MLISINEHSTVYQRKGDRLIVYEFEVGGFYVLNSSAMLIFEQIDGKRSVHEIAQAVQAMTDGVVDENDVISLIDELRMLNIIRTCPEITSS